MSSHIGHGDTVSGEDERYWVVVVRYSPDLLARGDDTDSLVRDPGSAERKDLIDEGASAVLLEVGQHGAVKDNQL